MSKMVHRSAYCWLLCTTREVRACDAGVSLPVVDQEDMETLAADNLYSSANCAQLLLQSTIVDKVTRPASR